MYIIKLTDTSWIADWEGDPGRTLKLQNAKCFNLREQAEKALKKTMKRYGNRDFSKSAIVKVEIRELPND